VTGSAFDVAADLLVGPTPDPYVDRPADWARDRLGVHLWSKQSQIAQALVDHRRTAVKSCHDVGKSFLAGLLATWWIDTHPPGSAFVVSTAPTYKQVHAILWEEIRGHHRRADLPGRALQSDEWKLDDGTLVGYGRKPADTDEHGFQGIHRRFVLVIIDEACGVPEQLWTAVEAITTNADCRILAIGNPDDPNTEFGNVCKPGSGWNVIGIAAHESPNFTDEPVPDHIRPLLLSPEWVEDKKRRWGVESPRYQSKVLGEFPDVGQDTLISPRLIEAAQERALDLESDLGSALILGVDVARYGTDRTEIYSRQGPVVRAAGSWAKQSTMETVGQVIAVWRGMQAEEIRVDGVGVGGGVVDRLAEQGFPVFDMQAGGAPMDRERFLNARAEWSWALRERFEQGDIDLDPDDDELAAQLGTIKYRYTSRGQVQIESKDEIRKRGLPSPDKADAVILTAGPTPPDGRIFGVEDLDPEMADFTISRY
jgi:hypothetical protein